MWLVGAFIALNIGCYDVKKVLAQMIERI